MAEGVRMAKRNGRENVFWLFFLKTNMLILMDDAWVNLNGLQLQRGCVGVPLRLPCILMLYVPAEQWTII